MRGGLTALTAAVLALLIASPISHAQELPLQEFPLPRVTIDVGTAKNPRELSTAIQILLLITVLSLAPAFLIMMTSFTRIIVVLSFLRHGLATQQTPPNQVLAGLALFLTIFTMMPTWREVNDNAIKPYLDGRITQQEAFRNALAPLREFMLRQTREKDLALMVKLAGIPRPRNENDVPTYVLIPAFVISELKTAFQIGFLIFIPFLMIDMVVASVLMAMGMMMVPPVMVSLPFKILLFVLVDGWNLVVGSLIRGFR